MYCLTIQLPIHTTPEGQYRAKALSAEKYTPFIVIKADSPQANHQLNSKPSIK